MTEQDYIALKERLEQLTIDIRLEAILCEVAENLPLDESMIQVRPVGQFNRGHKKDLKNIEVVKVPNLDVVKHLQFYVNREGLFDALPKRMFFKIGKRQFDKDAERIQAEAKVQQKEEAAAREFFLPLEQEFFRQRVAIERSERAVLSGFSHPEVSKVFSTEFWGFQHDKIPEVQLVDLLHALPYVFRAKGDLQESARLLSVILRKEVDIAIGHGTPVQCGELAEFELGTTVLGGNTVLGGDYWDGTPTLKVEIRYLAPNELPAFFRGGGQYQILRVFYDYFLPYEATIEEEFFIEKEKQGFVLDGTPHNGILGHSTYLNENKNENEKAVRQI